MIVTIDGPAGAGKSSVARKLAERLGFRFLDTGAMYRALAYIAFRRGWPVDDEDELARRAEQLDLQIEPELVLVDGEDVTPYLRSPEVNARLRHIAGNQRIRELLVRLQQQYGATGDLVTEGRDQGTVAFPDADCKIYLTASAEERAKRRAQQLQANGQAVEFEQVLRDQQERDQRDANRSVGPLAQADDALVVVTDGMTLDDVVDHLEMLVRNAPHRMRRLPTQDN
jgi:cytidylate kinase